MRLYDKGGGIVKYIQVGRLKSVTENHTIHAFNQETRDAIVETLSRELMVFDSVEEFFKDLDI